MNTRRVLPFVLAGGLAAISIIASAVGLFESWSLRTTDRLFLSRDANPNIVLIAIDDASLAKVGRWPWPRSVHANIIDKLSNAGVSAIAYDVNFPEPSNTVDDQALASSIRSAGNVILPVELQIQKTSSDWRFSSASSVQSIAEIQSATFAVGHTNLPLDVDNVARTVPLLVKGQDGSVVNAFAVEVAKTAGSLDLASIPQDRFHQTYINYPNAPGRAFQTISASDLLDGKNLPDLRGHVAFVGATARNLHDDQLTPVSDGVPMSGIEIHASIYDTLVSKQWLQALPFALQAAIILLFGIVLALSVTRLRARNSVILVVGLWLALVIASFIAFDRGYRIDIVWPTLFLIFTYVGLLLERWIETDRQKRSIRSAFSRYVSPSVVDVMLKHPEKLALGGERRRMTVLFSDLRGFTTLSEGLSPEKLVEVLNTYLHEMTSIVFAENGVLDKYIGDAVMAFWNAPLDQHDHALRAVRTAIRMRDRLKEMNETGSFPAGITLKVGVGMNTGDMVVGNIGADMRYDYTVIGDAVNLASRTESLCKEYGSEILVTENTATDIRDHVFLRKLDKVAVKGKKEPILLYQVVALIDKVTPEQTSKVEAFHAILDLYFAKKFLEAKDRAKQFLETYPDDVTTQHLLERCDIYLMTPPPADWDGTWVMTKK